MEVAELDRLFRPKSIAVIGASTQKGKIGYTVMDNLVREGYEGAIYPINPKEDQIMGVKAYPSVLDVPGPIDSAVISIPAKFCSQAIEECGKKGVKGLIIITSGFGEIGNHALEEELVEIAKKYNMRILGPNIVGTLSNTDKMNASFAPFLPYPGKSSLVTQSGALLIAMDASTFTRHVGFDKMISIGNMSDVDFADVIKWLDQDEGTTCMCFHIEGVRDGRAFIDAARNSKKPIVTLKAGVSAHGVAAAASHTGSLAGSAKIFSAALNQAGIIQATDLNNLFDRTLVLSLQPMMTGDNLLLITNGGGVGVLATDAAEKSGLPLKFAPEDLQEEMRKYMPEFGSPRNPVDLTGMAGNEWYEKTVNFAYQHKWVDGLVVLYCETAQTNPEEIAQAIYKGITEAGIRKPVTVCFVGGERSAKAMSFLVDHGIPAYGVPDQAVSAIVALREYAHIKEMVGDPIIKDASFDEKRAREIITRARAEGREALLECDGKQLLACYNLTVAKTLMAKTEDEAARLAERMGYPIVMKIVSPDIIHKSDAGGVKVNVKNEQQMRENYKIIMENALRYKPDAEIVGMIIQEMAPWGTEVIIGSINDPSFGPTLMFGLGGIFVEVLKDVTFRVAPISNSQAREVLKEIRGGPILDGVRGEPPRDKAALIEAIRCFSHLIVDLQDEIAEVDANPVMVYENGQGVKVIDARVILRKK